MYTFLGTVLVGVICIVIGISNTKGNISMLHSYHRSRVKEEDVLPFGKTVGAGMIITGIAVAVNGVLSFASVYFDKSILITVGIVALVVGLVVGLGLTFYAMIKYNKGIF